MRQSVVRLLGLLALALTFGTFTPTPVFAHASIVSTDPVYQSTLESMPSSVSIEFTDDLLLIGGEEVNRLALIGPDEKEITMGSMSVIQNVMTANLAPAEYQSGTYRVEYRVVSADGHVIKGSYDFYLNEKSSESTPTTTHQNHEESFFHVHKSHFYWGGTALILLILWAAWYRFIHEQDE